MSEACETMVVKDRVDNSERLARERDEALARDRAEWLATDRNAHDAVLAPLARVSRQAGLLPLAARLEAIRTWLARDLLELESELASVQQRDTDLALKAAAWLLARPGKRIRPLCVVLGARLGPARPGRTDERAPLPPDRLATAVRDLAVACELAHAATLLHDDVVDQGQERRGAPTARVVFGNPASVLGGDHLLVEALRRVDRAGSPPLLSSFLDVIGSMVAGEALQLERRGRFDPDPDVYDRVVQAKTASLFAWALRAGATVAGCPTDQVAAAAQCGVALGTAFQLADDALDLAGDPRLTGKDALLDLREGKLTWPLIVACQREPGLLGPLRAVAADPAVLDDPGRREALRDRLLATGCVEETRARARRCGAEADLALQAFAPGPARLAMAAVVAAAVDRDH